MMAVVSLRHCTLETLGTGSERGALIRCKGKTLLELEETHSWNGKGLRHSQLVLEARDIL
jgi:hypothetical protein